MNKKKRIKLLSLSLILIVVIIYVVNFKINLKESVTIEDTMLTFYVDESQTTTIPSDTSSYYITIVCNNNVEAVWNYDNDTVEITNLVNNSISNFKCNVSFEEKSYLIEAVYSASTTATFLNTELIKTEIESIELTNFTKVPSDALGSFDVSNDSGGQINLWFYDNDNNGLFEVYIGQNGGVLANPISSYLFYGMSSLTNLNISKLDTTNVTNMKYMFFNCKNITDLDVSNFVTTNVTSTEYMFYDCRSLISLDVANFDTSQVVSMQYMFHYCSNLTSLDVSDFDTSKVKLMKDMFSECHSLVSLIIDFNTSQATTMQDMFSRCESLVSLDLSKFNTSKITIMDNMFNKCYCLISLNLSNFETSQVTSMSNMFYSCNSLMNINMYNADFSNVTSYSDMFTSVPTGCELIVKDSIQKAWIETNTDFSGNVVV